MSLSLLIAYLLAQFYFKMDLKTVHCITMIRQYLFTIIIAAVFLGGCNKPKPVILGGLDYYLVSADRWKSEYKQIHCMFKETDVEIFKIKNLRTYVGDVTIGHYSFSDNVLSLPQMGSFNTKQTTDGFDLYNKGKLKYRLSRKSKLYIRPGAIDQHQSQFASITK